MAAPRAPFNVTALNIEVPADGQREVTFSVATGVLDDTWTVEIAGTTVAEGDGTDSFVAVFPASADGQRWQLSHEGIERVAGVVIPRPLRNALDLTTLELTVDDGGTVVELEVVAVGPVGPPGVVAATGIATYDDLTQTIDVPMPTAADVGAATPADVAAAVAPKLNASDPSVTNARTPTPHKISHATGGTDPLTPSDIGAATAAQGATADTAVQPGNLAPVATTGDYDDLTGKPTLGTAAAEDVTDFATAAQGVLAGTAVQPGDLSAVATTGAYADLSGAPSIPDDPGDIGAATAAQGALADTALQPGDIGSSVQAHVAVLDATTASFTTADETKLDGIAAGAEINVQSDWNAGSGDAQILNKPTLGTAAAAATTDFATAAQGSTADSALQPTDLSGTGLVTYTSGTGVIDVDEDDVTDIAETVVGSLPELANSFSNVIREDTPGFVTVEAKAELLAIGQAINTTSEVALTPTLNPIPAGLINDTDGGLITMDCSGIINQESGANRTLTLRIKRVLDPLGTPSRATVWTFTVTDIPTGAGIRAWTLLLPVRITDLGFGGEMVVGTAQFRLFTAAGAIAYDLGAQISALAGVTTAQTWALELTAQWSGTGATVYINHIVGLLRHERTS